MSQFHEKLLKNNRTFSTKTNEEMPGFLKELAEGQSPPVLWIGCSDSRVPAEKITGAKPGDIFVHRNIANMVIHTDISMLSVLDYAVNQLKVRHIIVCGHYECGGVQAAMGNQSVGLIDNWLRHIKDTYRFHKEELKKLKDDPKAFFRAMVEYNVIEQVHSLGKTSIVQEAWLNTGQEGPTLHGWVYDLHSGLIKELDTKIQEAEELEGMYQLALEAE